ncbi:hypothetical protein A2886_00265 [candidate division WWE3 bacterium RIFCSPHIGHO2_01_FULL_42_13]|uniref:Uncharacterized protein n=1 Tax=candidate division WWE3 bacterium RIFCSPHIGHO2_01_FULL_42_13 TaxID=1802617 RepID=A0A1F4US56_UNCKA|nr:MAG: hypothetical protein A2886_00265 [candidate division WWE3 bacterium RIFCSPHIGHO2_01_FULL_42_13]
MFDNYLNPIANIGEFTTLGDYVAVALNVAFGIGAAISLIAVILSGIKYITSRGDIKAATSAKNALTYSIIAMILTITAYTIVGIVSGVFTEQEIPILPVGI